MKDYIIFFTKDKSPTFKTVSCESDTEAQAAAKELEAGRILCTDGSREVPLLADQPPPAALATEGKEVADASPAQ